MLLILLRLPLQNWDLTAPVVQGRRNITGLQLFYSHSQRAQKQTSNGKPA